MAFLKSVYVKKESITWFTANMRTTIKKRATFVLIVKSIFEQSVICLYSLPSSG